MVETSMRASPARLAAAAAFAAILCPLGCANRGMVAPDDGDITGGGGGGIRTDAGSGGASGKGGSGGVTHVDAGCNLVTDALYEHSTSTCGAMFNFEGGTEGATLLAGTQAFTGVTAGTTPHTYCGTGSLAIAASFSGTTGAKEKGEVDLPLGVDGGSANLAGKTLTVRLSAAPITCGDLRFAVTLNTTAGQTVVLRLSSVTSNWTTASVTLAADGGVTATNKIALQAFSTTNYAGTIYVDEIDVR